jgi:hypothetical protein
MRENKHTKRLECIREDAENVEGVDSSPYANERGW